MMGAGGVNLSWSKEFLLFFLKTLKSPPLIGVPNLLFKICRNDAFTGVFSPANRNRLNFLLQKYYYNICVK
jgi:hypothetical protein